MKEKKIKNLIKCKKGEMLIESVAAIFVFGITMLIVTVLVGASINMTANANKKATHWQETAVNSAILENFNSSDEKMFDIKFKSILNTDISVKNKIVMTNENGVFAFYPVEPTN